MRVLRGIFDFYLDASIHVALAAWCLIRISTHTLNIPPDIHLEIFLFLSTIAAYNFIKYGVEAEKYFWVSNVYHKRIQLFSFLCLGVAIYHGFFLTSIVYGGLAGIALLVILYAIPVLPRSSKLRNWGIVKIGIVGLVWTITTVLLPVLQQGMPVSWDVLLEGIQRFLFVIVWILPFEIRDLRSDSPDLQTLPQRVGIRNTKTIGIVLIVLYMAITGFKDDIAFQAEIVKLTIALILLVLLELSQREQPKYFSSFVVEAIPLLWYGGILVLEAFYS